MSHLVVAVVSLAAGIVIARALTGRAGEPVVAAPASAPPLGDDAVVSALDELTTAVVLADATGRVVHRNRAARQLAGTHAGVLIGAAIERHLARARSGGPTEELLELYGPPKVVVMVRATPSPDGGAFAFVDDISERRRIDAVRTDFVANISHELKTPVGALAVLAETLVDETDPVLVRRIADRMLEESHRAARTIDDLLELSRIELGGERVHDGVDVNEVVRCAVERADALAERRGIRVVAEAAPPGFTVTGDRRQLVSAVGNLVENAVKYSEDHGTVHLRARHRGAWVEFEVVDQGVGIPARDLDRIFERFYRVDKARSRGTGGTGLGLSIVRHVATNHGGDVVVSSAEGEGSTFVLRIPATHVADHPATSVPAVSHPAAPDPHPHSHQGAP